MTLNDEPVSPKLAAAALKRIREQRTHHEVARRNAASHANRLNDLIVDAIRFGVDLTEIALAARLPHNDIQDLANRYRR